MRRVGLVGTLSLPLANSPELLPLWIALHVVFGRIPGKAITPMSLSKGC